MSNVSLGMVGERKKCFSVPGSLRVIDMPRIFPCCPNPTLNRITDFTKGQENKMYRNKGWGTENYLKLFRYENVLQKASENESFNER